MMIDLMATQGMGVFYRLKKQAQCPGNHGPAA